MRTQASPFGIRVLNPIYKEVPIQMVKLIYLIILFFILGMPIHAQKKLDFDREKVLLEISNKVKGHFYKKSFDTIVWNDKVNKCLRQMTKTLSLDQFDQTVNELLASLNTSHTYFYSRNNPKRYQLLGIFNSIFDKNDLSLFQYEGIGIDTRTIDEKIFVISVYDGMPAAKAGLTFGDQIISVDGNAFHPIESFQNKSEGSVTIEYIRDKHSYTLDIPVALLDGRTMFETALQSSIQIVERKEKKIGYVHLWSYAGTKYQEQLREAVLWGKLSQCDALIIDLRDGWGGADINYLNLFRKPIAVINSTTREEVNFSYSGVWEKPVALLINERSTSGKELFTYGFKKLRIGKVIGEKTAGAVVAGRVFKLSTGDVLYLAVNDIQVDEKRLEGVGVKPDLYIERSILFSDNDPQLKGALNTLSH